MGDKQKYVVLRVIEGKEGFMATYGPQVATVSNYDSKEHAATFNVGSHPAVAKRGKPYRVIVIPWEHWNEFQVYSERHKNRDEFVAYPTDDPEDLTIRPNVDSK